MTVLGAALHVVVGWTQKSRLGQVRVCFPAPWMEPPHLHYSYFVWNATGLTVPLGLSLTVPLGLSSGV
jgi:hypothetical protein